MRVGRVTLDSHLMRICAMRIECALGEFTSRGGLELTTYRNSICCEWALNGSHMTNYVHHAVLQTCHMVYLRELRGVMRAMATGWTGEETKALIAVWEEANVQCQFNSVKRNKDIYEHIAAQLSTQGFSKTWKQCRVKI